MSDSCLTVNPFLHIYSFQHKEINIVGKGEITQISIITFFHNVFYGISFLKPFNSRISVVVCSFFEFGTVSKWCIREWVKCINFNNKLKLIYTKSFSVHGNTELHQIYQIIPNYTELYQITPPSTDLNMQKTYFLTYIYID